MRKGWWIALLSGAMTQAYSAELILTSPDRAQTFAYGEMVWHQLLVDPVTKELVARITFSNLRYVGSPESRADELFNFRFPRTCAEIETGKVYGTDGRGHRIPVARFRGDPTNGWVDLGGGAKIYLLKRSGRVTAVLTATSEPRPGMRWIQLNDNWSFQNLLAGIWRVDVSPTVESSRRRRWLER